MDDNIVDNVDENSEDSPIIIHEGEEGYETNEKKDELSEEPESDEVEAEKSTRKPRIPAKTRINDISRKYHAELRRAEEAERELYRIKEENENLKRSYESSSKAVVSSQEGMIDAIIQRAKQMQQKAIEEGDVQGQVDATAALAEAYADKRNLDAWKTQQKAYEEVRQREPEKRPESQQKRQSDVHITPEAEEWLENNGWFSEDSEEFDPELQQLAVLYSQSLDRRYHNAGVGHMIQSQEYFDEIDRYMNRKLQRNQNTKPQGELVMNRPRNTVSGVTRNGTQGNQRETFRMSQAEREMARAMNWSDEQWFKNKKLAARMEADGRLKSGSGNGYGRV